MEVKRQLDVLDRRLADRAYLAGSEYTITDIAVFPWYGGLAKGWQYSAAEFLSVQDYKNVQRWADAPMPPMCFLLGDPLKRVHRSVKFRDLRVNADGVTACIRQKYLR